LFEGNTEFSASNPQAPPLLEVSIPIGASFRNEPGDIVNSSIAPDPATNIPVGLQVQPGKNISLLGGDVSLESGGIYAPGGRVELGGLNSAGIIGINADGSLSFPENVERGNVFLSNSSVVSVLSGAGGSIAINSKNLELTEGSSLYAGIGAGLGSPEAQAGDIVINATDKVSFDGVGANGLSSGSGIYNSVFNQGIGNTGKVKINTSELSFTNGGRILTSVSGQGNTGEIAIDANQVSFDDIGGIIRSISQSSVGDTGNIRITTGNLSLTNGGTILSTVSGQGNTGDVKIKASENISFDGKSISANVVSYSGIANTILATGSGSTGNVNIGANNFSLTNGASVSNSNIGKGTSGKIAINTSDTLSIVGGSSDDALQNFSRIATFVGGSEDKIGSGEGDSGAIEINTKNLAITNGGGISSQVNAKGNSGDIIVNASDTTRIDGESPLLSSRIESSITDIGIGNAGTVNLNTKNLIITNGGGISSLVVGKGNAEDVSINASDSIFLDGESQFKTLSSRIFSVVGNPGVGNSGNINIATKDLSVTNGATISSDTNGIGNAGNISIVATERISLDGTGRNSFPISLDGTVLNTTSSSQIASGVLPDAIGNGGKIEIATTNLKLNDGATISASTIGEGDAGSIKIEAKDDISIDNSSIDNRLLPGAIGNGGDISINGKNVSLLNNSNIGSDSGSKGDAGNIQLDASENFILDNSSVTSDVIFSSATEINLFGEGNAGNIDINSRNISLNASQVSTSNTGKGNTGIITIKANDNFFAANNSTIFSNIEGESSARPAEGKIGAITVEAKKVTLTGDSSLEAAFRSNAKGESGSVSAKATDFISFNDRSGIRTSVAPGASANGGDIQLEAKSISFSKNSGLSASNLGQGNGGNIKVTVDFLNLDLSQITGSNTPSEAFTTDLEGGNIELNIYDQLILRNSSNITARANQNADGGNVTINAPERLIIAFPNQNNDITANASQGRGGDINITAQSIFGLEERPLNPFTNDINASSEFGLQGDIAINTPDIDPTSGLINLPASVGDASDQISQNPCEQGIGSEFIITGKGGLPPNVNESLNSESAQVGLIEAVPSQQQTVGAFAKLPKAYGIRPNPSTISELVPAQGWVFNEEGEVTLTAYKTTNAEIKRSPPAIRSSCSALSKGIKSLSE
jgi:large exoprotein involved in heme utilization and adhesion